MRQKWERSLLFDVLLSFVFNLYGILGMELFRDQRNCALVGLCVVLCAYVHRLADDMLGEVDGVIYNPNKLAKEGLFPLKKVFSFMGTVYFCRIINTKTF